MCDISYETDIDFYRRNFLQMINDSFCNESIVEKLPIFSTS